MSKVKKIISTVLGVGLFTGSVVLMFSESLETLFYDELHRELAKYRNKQRQLISEKDIAHLPEPVRKYFRYTGFIGKEKAHCVKVVWKEFYLKMSPDKEWTLMESSQYNFMDIPARLSYMKTKMLGVIPFEGRDKYQDGHGNMMIKLMKIITVGNSSGKQMDASALVTILAESLFIPSYALQPYIKWTPINAHSAKATIKDGASEASGIFHFNEVGACFRFDTNDRYFAGKDGGYTQTKWSAIINGYMDKEGLRIPSELSTVWHTSNGEYTYFKGTIQSISNAW